MGNIFPTIDPRDIALSSPPLVINRDNANDYLSHIPKEILNQIFENLGPGVSTCLGLTCKALYTIHRSFHGRVSLKTPMADMALTRGRTFTLDKLLLKGWVGTGVNVCKRCHEVFIYETAWRVTTGTHEVCMKCRGW